MDSSKFKSFIARHRLRFGLGTSLVGTFLYVFSLLTFAKVWEETFKFYNIPTILIYIGMPISYVAICWLIGYIYDTKGFWEEENSHSNKNLNPEFFVLCESMERVDKKLDKLKEELDAIGQKK